MKNKGQYRCDRVVSFEGREGEPLLQGNLYRGKTRIAFVSDDSHGGPMRINWLDRETKAEVKTRSLFGEERTYQGTFEEALLAKHCYEIPPTPSAHLNLGKLEYTDPEIFLGNLLNLAAETKRFKRMAKTRLLFRQPGDERGAWRSLNRPDSPESRSYVTQKYAGAVFFCDGKHDPDGDPIE